MTIINFTQSATPISDFLAEKYVQGCLHDIEADVEYIAICNVLVLNLLRAELINSPLKYQVRWQFEGEPVYTDKHMRSSDLWRNPVMELDIKALLKLLEPTTLQI